MHALSGTNKIELSVPKSSDLKLKLLNSQSPEYWEWVFNRVNGFRFIPSEICFQLRSGIKKHLPGNISRLCIAEREWKNETGLNLYRAITGK